MADNGDVEVLTPIPRPYEGKPAHNAYPPEVKQQAVELAVQLRSSVKAAHQLGIPSQTVQKWVAEEMARNAGDWDAFQVKELEDRIEQILARVEPDKIEKAGLRDVVIAAGVLFDKRAALLGTTGRKDKEPTRKLRVVWKDGSGAVEVEE